MREARGTLTERKFLMFPPQKVAVTCPQCRTPYSVDVYSIVDVKQEPALKQELLRGQLNLSVCPTCGQENPLNAPLLYHDPSHDLLAIYLPTELGASEMERQRIIGELMNRLMTQVPSQERRGYLLQPRQFLTMQSLMDAILMADGYTREELDKQRARASLLQRIIAAVGNEEMLRTLVREHDGELDGPFFGFLTAVAEDALAAGKEQLGNALFGLRELLLSMCSFGKKVLATREAVASLSDKTTREELLEKIVAARDDEVVDALVMAARPLVDYVFFQQLTRRADSLKSRDKAEAKRLERLRDHIVDLTASLDRSAREAMERAADTLRDILSHADVREGVRQHEDEIDDAFLSVLSMNLQAAQQQGRRDIFETLRQVWDEVQNVLDKGSPPEMRLLNRLMRAEYPEETRALLAENRAQLTEEFLNIMDGLAAQLEEDKATEAAKKMRAIRAQAVLIA
jgi:hypothetical protein